MRCGIRNKGNNNDKTTYLFCYLVFNRNWSITLVKFGITVRCYTTCSYVVSKGCSLLFEMFTSFSSRFILLVFLFNRLPKFKYIEEFLCLIILEINLQESAFKNAKLLNYIFSHQPFILLSFCLNL